MTTTPTPDVEEPAIVRKARAFAIKAHGEQKYGEHPYSYHLDAVAELVRPYGKTALVVAYLHDVLEDTDTHIDEVTDTFCTLNDHRITAAVDLVSKVAQHRAESARLQKSYYMRRLRRADGPKEAFIVKTADRLANVIECQKNNPELLAKYRAEHREFTAACYRPGLCEDLWDRLDTAIHGDIDHLTRSLAEAREALQWEKENCNAWALNVARQGGWSGDDPVAAFEYITDALPAEREKIGRAVAEVEAIASAAPHSPVVFRGALRALATLQPERPRKSWEFEPCNCARATPGSSRCDDCGHDLGCPKHMLHKDTDGLWSDVLAALQPAKPADPSPTKADEALQGARDAIEAVRNGTAQLACENIVHEGPCAYACSLERGHSGPCGTRAVEEKAAEAKGERLTIRAINHLRKLATHIVDQSDYLELDEFVMLLDAAERDAARAEAEER